MSKRFTLEGLRNLKQTGSLVKSSKVLARSLAKENCFKNKLVLELGAGEGVITKELLESLGDSGELHSFEINEVFIKSLNSIDDNRLQIRNNCVFEIGKYYAKNSVDLIVSCLPLANFSKEKKRQLLSEVKKVLKDGGRFIQYQYSLNDLRLMKKNFHEVDVGYCVLNLPPAFIYKCEL